MSSKMSKMSKNYNVSAAGSSISFLAGACLCAGANLLQLCYNVTIKNEAPDRYYISDVSSIAFLGGGMLSFGLYILAPNNVRELWY
jgi:hypothetical protein